MGAMAWADIGFCALNLGQPEQASAMFEKGLTISTAAKILSKPQLLMGQGMLKMMDGDIPGALEIIDEAESFSNSVGMRQYGPFFGLMRGMMHAAAGDSKSALESLEDSKSKALKLGMLPTALQASFVAAGVINSQSDDSASEAAIAECESLIKKISDSIRNSQISETFVTAARANLPA